MTENSYQLSDSFGYLTYKEISAIKYLVDLLRRNAVVVNIGAGAGTSGLAILEERSDVSLVTIDMRVDSPLGSLKSEMNAIEKAGLGDVSHRHQQILGMSAQKAVDFADESVDMVFVDGDHTRRGVRRDISAWLPKVKSGGIIAFHDYGNNSEGVERWPEVRIAVDELIEPFCLRLIQLDSVVGYEVS